jgi:hypothetical protein
MFGCWLVFISYSHEFFKSESSSLFSGEFLMIAAFGMGVSIALYSINSQA